MAPRPAAARGTGVPESARTARLAGCGARPAASRGPRRSWRSRDRDRPRCLPAPRPAARSRSARRLPPSGGPAFFVPDRPSISRDAPGAAFARDPLPHQVGRDNSRHQEASLMDRCVTGRRRARWHEAVVVVLGVVGLLLAGLHPTVAPRAEAATAVLSPNGDVSNGWQVKPGGAAWASVDDAVSQPTAVPSTDYL